MKRIISFILSALMIAASIAAVPANAETSGDWEYTVIDNEATVIKYNGSAAQVDIPSTLGGYSVTSIGSNAFIGCTSLTSVMIPNSVTSIGLGAFYNCNSITTMTIPEGVTTIGDYAFFGCTGLTSMTIPSSVTSIGSHALDGCTSLTNMTIPSSVTSIGNYAFSGCTGITSMKIPSSVTSIGDFTFFGCSGLTSVKIPNSVTSIGSHAFSGCTGLTSVTIPSSVTSIGTGAFNCCTGLTSVTIPNSVRSIGAYAFSSCSGLASVTIDSDVTSIDLTSIESHAFYCCSGLKIIMIPSSLTSIGFAAFSGCTELTDVFYGGSNSQWSVISIESENTLLTSASRHYNCAYISGDFGYSVNTDGSAVIGEYLGSAAQVAVPETLDGHTVTSIGQYAFYNYTGLTSVTIPDSVTSIGEGAFWGCTGLTSVTIPDSLTSIGFAAFSGCTGLSDVYYEGSSSQWSSISIGSSNSSLTNAAKHYNTFKLGDWYYSVSGGEATVTKYNGSAAQVEIPSTLGGYSVTSIGEYAFEGCNSLTSVTIPSGVTSIKEGAFSGCTCMTDITIPLSVTSIGYLAFASCYSLTSVTIPSGVTFIEGFAFAGCYSLENVTIPSGVTTIEISAFDSCKTLTSVTIPAGVTSIGDCAFNCCTGLSNVTIPSSVTSIGDRAFSGCSALTDVYYTGSGSQWNAISIGSNNTPLSSAAKHFVSGDFAYTVNTDGSAVIGEYLGNAAELDIPSSLDGCTVTAIGENAFRNCTSLTCVTIPSSVTSIGEGAFSGCSSLTEIALPFTGDKPHASSDTYQYPFGYIFGENSYAGAAAARQYYYGSTTSSTTYSTYYIPSSLTKVILTDCTYLPYGAFHNCSSLTDVTIPASLVSIGRNAFYGCADITVSFGNDVTTIASSLFKDVAEIKNVKIGENVTSIDTYAFQGCTGLTDVIIPEGVTTIKNHAFSYCSSLKSVVIPKSVTLIGQNAFRNCSALTDVYYCGTSAQWNGINVAANNDPLTNAAKHFDYHIHSLTFNCAAGPGCTEQGYAVDNYYCSVCGKYFSDPNAEIEISESDVVIPALGHNVVEQIINFDPECRIGSFICSRCGAIVDGEHTWGDWVRLDRPTCTEEGFENRWCIYCDECDAGRIVPALGHDYVASVTEPTCTEDGYTTYVCSRCQDTYSADETPALGHDYVASVTEPTCTEGGYTTYVCSRCQDTYSVDETPATGHDYAAAITEPTCTEGGYTTYVCSRCGDTYTADETPALGHEFGDWTVSSAPSCTETGVETRRCAECGAEEQRIVPALGHDYVDAVIEPTCTEDGYTTYVCSRCGDTYTADETPALGHDFENGICSRCGEADPGAAVIAVRDITAHPGDTVEIAVDISNDPGFAAAIVWIDFDPDVFLIGDTEDTDDWIFAENGALPSLITVNADTAGRIGMVFARGSDSRANGNLVTVVLTVANDAAPGDYEISVSVPQINNVKNETVPCRTVNAVASVSNILYGDANSDGVVDLSDVIILCRYLLDASEKTGDGADANADGTIDLTDVIIVCQYLLDNTIILGPQN